MKKTILLLAVTLSMLTANNNIGFLINQKYICATKGYVTKDGLIPTPQEEALKYPIRFFVDDNNVLHTDGKMSLPHFEKNTYSDGDNVMGFTVKDNKRYLVVTNNKLSALGSSVLYVCAETKNWTLAK